MLPARGLGPTPKERHLGLVTGMTHGSSRGAVSSWMTLALRRSSSIGLVRPC